MKLLTPAAANAKTSKNDASRFLSAILHLAPATLSGIPGFNVCPAASEGCKAACLNTAGRGRFNNVQEARIRKTKLFYANRKEFWELLVKDLNYIQAKAKREGKIPVVRLNGTSDLSWETLTVLDTGMNVFELYPNIQFYDYTKVLTRLAKPLPKNYDITFSASEVNDKACQRALELGFRVAVVFDSGNFPKVFWNKKVVDGDGSDLRFLDKKGVVVALKAKGKAKKDTSGFVRPTSINENKIAS